MAVNIGPGEIGLFQGNDKFKVDEIASLRVVWPVLIKRYSWG